MAKVRKERHGLSGNETTLCIRHRLRICPIIQNSDLVSSAILSVTAIVPTLFDRLLVTTLSRSVLFRCRKLYFLMPEPAYLAVAELWLTAVHWWFGTWDGILSGALGVAQLV